MKNDQESAAGQTAPEQTAPSTAPSTQPALADNALDNVSGGVVMHEILDWGGKK